MTKGAEVKIPKIPSYDPLNDQGQLVVRRMMSETTHLLLNPEDVVNRIEPSQWIGAPYWALFDTYDTVCRIELKPDRRGLVVMQPGTRVKCRVCRRFAAIAQGEESNA